jgi:esterase/lipase superfamily enzyme
MQAAVSLFGSHGRAFLDADLRSIFTPDFHSCINLISQSNNQKKLKPMPKYWMISIRNDGGTGGDRNKNGATFWTSDAPSDQKLRNIANWQKSNLSQFRKALIDACANFPDLPPEEQEEEKHVALCVHGYNNSFEDSIGFYTRINNGLFSGQDGLGICILFTWPSEGQVYGYLPDRAEARACADDLGEVLNALYDVLVRNEALAAEDPSRACKAKISIISHSMGNYLTQMALFHVWKRNNSPLTLSLVNQLLMVAADVDNDIFDSGEQVGDGDGEGIANLTYRVTAFYSGRDSVLGLSGGLKHFGKRRLGRSGLDRTAVTAVASPDNVWDTDCSEFFAKNESSIHSAYFKFDQYPPLKNLMRQVLRGVDRGVLVNNGIAAANSWWANKQA